MPTPLKPGETPESITEWVLWSVRNDPDIDLPSGQEKIAARYIRDALRVYGDRRGEEERAKALERVGALEKQLSEWRVAISRHLTATKNAPPTAVHCEACELADGGWCRSCAPLAALLGQPALAAAPSGGAPAVQRGDGSVYFDRLVEARAPSGDAKGTK